MLHPLSRSGDRPSASPVHAATTLALWSAAWASGACADTVVDVLAATGMRAGVRAASRAAADRSGLPGPGEPSAGSVDLLPLLRRGGAAELLLPVPGDLRGLPIGGDIITPALDAGAVVVLPEAGVGLVPIDRQWRAYLCTASHAAIAMKDATMLVDEAVREATTALLAADIASGRGDPRTTVREHILANEVDIPPGMPTVASSLLATAMTLRALLTVAAAHDNAAVSQHELAAVDDALGPLHAAVREAQRTAVAATTYALHPATAPATQPTATSATRRPSH